MAIYSGESSLLDDKAEGHIGKLSANALTNTIDWYYELPSDTKLRAWERVERPMVLVIIGGRVTSTLLNLFLLPALYGRFGSQRSR